MTLRLVETADDWSVVSWLWQAYRHDISHVTGGLPRANGRYSTRDLNPAPGSRNHAGYVWWEQNERGPSPGGFAVVSGLTGARRSIDGFWVAPPLRRSGVGLQLALEVIGQHRTPWVIAFQHGNTGAGAFWRQVAERAFGPRGTAWSETERPVAGMANVPPDHWIETI